MTMLHNLRWFILPCLLSLPSVAVAQAAASETASRADHVARAQALFDEAKALMAANRYEEACARLEESQRLDPGSGTLINLGHCYEQTARVASAFRAFTASAAAARAAGNAEREQVAQQRAAAVAPRVPKLVLSVSAAAPPGLEVTLDGVAVPRKDWGVSLPLDPGTHRVSARAPGRPSFETSSMLAADGATVTVSIPELGAGSGSADTAAQSGGGLGTQKTVALAAGGLGVAGVIVGSVFGLISNAKHDESDEYCTGNSCWDPKGVDAMDSARTAGSVSTVAFVVGTAGLAASAALWFTAGSDQSTASASVGVGPGSLAARYTW